MANQKPTAVNALVQKLAASRPISWLLSRSLHHLDGWILKRSSKRKTLTGILAGAPVVMITMVGAKSGELRSLPLLCIRDPLDSSQFALIATNWGQAVHPAWYFNLKENPAALCFIDGRFKAHIAREAAEEEYDRFWQLAIDTYPGFAKYKTRAVGRRIPIMVMHPIP